MKKLNFSLPIPAFDANVKALQIFESLVTDNLTPDDISLVLKFLNEIASEHIRISILENNPDNKLI